MTPPPILAGGGLSLLVGPRPALLTEYAPVTVINTSLTDTIYLASDSNVSPAGGVPVAPSTAYVWQTAGPLYAVAPDALLPVPVVLTGSSDDWQPSPVAIGVAVAEQLSAAGIPLALKTTDIGTFALVGSGPTEIPADLSNFATLFVYISFAASDVLPDPIRYQFLAGDAGLGGPYGVGQPDTLHVGADGQIAGVLLPVLGSGIVFFNSSAVTGQIVLLGYNRSVVTRPTGSGFQSAGFSAYLSDVTPVFGGLFDIISGASFQGRGSFTLQFDRTIGAGAPSSWQLYFIYPDEPNVRYALANSGNLPLTEFGEVFIGQFEGTLPAMPVQFGIAFFAATSGTTFNIHVNAIPE